MEPDHKEIDPYSQSVKKTSVNDSVFSIFENNHIHTKDSDPISINSSKRKIPKESEFNMKNNCDLLDECITDLKTLITIKFKNNKIFEERIKNEETKEESKTQKEDIAKLLKEINSKLPSLEQLRWIVKEKEDLKSTYYSLFSLVNSFERLAKFCRSKIEEINAAEREEEMEDRK